LPVETQTRLRLSQHPREHPRPGDRTFEASLPVADAALHVELAAPPGRMTLPDVVPVARAVADESVDLLRARLEAAGQTVPCTRGCAACCRYLVPLSGPEALRLDEELSNMPAPRRNAVRRAFARAAQRVGSAGPPPAADGLKAVAAWYAEMDLDCPLLQDGLCSIYPARPIVCREFLVTSPAELCSRRDPEAGDIATPHVSVAEALAELAARLEAGPIESVLLPLALNWAGRNRRRGEQSWPTQRIAEELAQVLQALSTRAVAGGCAAA
jgi:Fe-S-cluster containining protein